MAWYGLGCRWLTCISSGHLTGQPGKGDCSTVQWPKGRKSIYGLYLYEMHWMHSLGHPALVLNVSWQMYLSKTIYNFVEYNEMPFVHATRLGNRTYQICCSMNHFQQTDQCFFVYILQKPEVAFTAANLTDQLACEKYRKMTISAFLFIICGWISWPEGQGLSWMDLTKISVEGSWENLEDPRNEMKVYNTWCTRNRTNAHNRQFSPKSPERLSSLAHR